MAVPQPEIRTDGFAKDFGYGFYCTAFEKQARRWAMGEDGLYHEISCAQTSHCENPEKIEQEWIEKYGLQSGSFDVLKVAPELVAALIRVYNHPICEQIDNYNGSMYYEPSDWLASEYKRAS